MADFLVVSMVIVALLAASAALAGLLCLTVRVKAAVAEPAAPVAVASAIISNASLKGDRLALAPAVSAMPESRDYNRDGVRPQSIVATGQKVLIGCESPFGRAVRKATVAARCLT